MSATKSGIHKGVGHHGYMWQPTNCHKIFRPPEQLWLFFVSSCKQKGTIWCDLMAHYRDCITIQLMNDDDTKWSSIGRGNGRGGGGVMGGVGVGGDVGQGFHLNQYFTRIHSSAIDSLCYHWICIKPNIYRKNIKRERRNCNPATSKVTATAWCELCVQSEMKPMHKVKDARQCYGWTQRIGSLCAQCVFSRYSPTVVAHGK